MKIAKLTLSEQPNRLVLLALNMNVNLLRARAQVF